MPKFKYVAINKKGKKIKGIKEAKNSAIIVKSLQKNNLYIISIHEEKQYRNILKYIKNFKKINRDYLIFFNQQLLFLLKAGVPLLESFKILKNETKPQYLKEVLNNIEKNIEKGKKISKALAEYPRIFPELYLQMIAAGEETGQLIPILQNLNQYYRNRVKMKNEVLVSLYYPLIIILVSGLIIIFLISKVIPQFVEILQSLGGEIIWPTQLLLTGSSILVNYWLIFLLFALFTGLAFYEFQKTYTFDRLVFKLPLLKNIIIKIYLTRFSGTLALLLKGGQDILTSLDIMKEAIGNKFLKKHINNAGKEVKEGLPLADAVSCKKIFQGLIIEMIKIGEESGQLVEVLEYLEDYYQQELKSEVDKKISLIEPILIVILSIFIGLIIISVLFPMFNIYTFV